MASSPGTVAKSKKFNKLELSLHTGSSICTLAFKGSLGMDDLASADLYLDTFINQQPSATQIIYDVSGLSYLDSAGAFLLYKYQQIAGQKGYQATLAGMKPDHERIYQLLDPKELAKKPLVEEARGAGFIESLGRGIYGLNREAYQIIDYFGKIIALSARTLVKPRAMRWLDMLEQMNQVGVGGLPIIGLIGLLLGMIIAFMSMLQLESFGASIYVASLVSVAMVKELGPIMTAIVVAGRSGSAFAAEIGSMKENEELDALSVMGYDPVMFLAMPRVAATVLVMPLLFIFSSFFGILGGLIIGVTGMGLEVNSYLHYTVTSLHISDFIVSIIKSIIFAFLIAGVGCQRGFSVRGGASAVGRATTSSVVISIFVIIVVDSIFAVVMQYAWWW